MLSVTKEGYGSGAHYRLIAGPLKEAGIQIDACMQKEIPAKLATGKYNVGMGTHVGSHLRPR